MLDSHLRLPVHGPLLAAAKPAVAAAAVGEGFGQAVVG
jgi:hypothetical protein